LLKPHSHFTLFLHDGPTSDLDAVNGRSNLGSEHRVELGLELPTCSVQYSLTYRNFCRTSQTVECSTRALHSQLILVSFYGHSNATNPPSPRQRPTLAVGPLPTKPTKGTGMLGTWLCRSVVNIVLQQTRILSCC
jgi:hypothetical protein